MYSVLGLRVDNSYLNTLVCLARYEIFLIARSIQNENGGSLLLITECGKLLDTSFKVSKMVFWEKIDEMKLIKWY